MASILRRSLILRRVVSAAAAAAPSGGEQLAARRTVPLHRLSHTSSPHDQIPKSLDENKVDQMQKQLDELNQLIEQDITEFLNKEYQSADHGYFESFLSRCGMAKSKSRDNFIWGCQVTTLYVLFVGVGYVLALVERS